ncbi:MAG: PQQ-binding-like beta-propeller repeat protein [bacterium]
MFINFKNNNWKTVVTLFILLFATHLSWSCRSLTIKHSLEKQSTNRNWILFGGEDRRINYRANTVAPPLKNVWIYKSTSAISPTLVVVNGVLYFATLDGRIEAVNIKTGKRIGRQKNEDNQEATCAFYKGNLIIASRYGHLTLANYNLENGKYLWKVDAGDIASEPLVADDGVYISALYNHIDKYDLNSGKKLWSFKTADQHRSSPALSKNILIVGCDNGTLYALNAETGTLEWQIQTDASIQATPIVWNHTIFVGSADSLFYAFNLSDGTIQWTFDAQRPLYQTAATDGKVVLFGASDGQFYCLNAETGKEIWRFRAKSVVSTAPVISGRVVYFGSLDRRYYCLNLEDGRELWSHETKGRIRTSPVVWGNYVFGASEDKFVYAFEHSKR